MKARATVGEFELKMWGTQTRVVRYRMKLSGGHLYAREL
jgi:hypothetical protein